MHRLAVGGITTLLLAACLAAQHDPVAVPEGASRDDVVQLAGLVRPSPRQLAWQATGMNAFVHFGINTFADREWGDGKESPTSFAPSEFDARQWTSTFRAAGMTGVVLTCKHHDGFCLWPSATTEHTVAASPFRDGRGDVVQEVAAACRADGLQFGIYLSPWDRHQPTFGSKAYEALFLRQLRELLTGYGPLFEVWFDGAHCPADDPSVFDWQAVFALVRELQPEAVIAITGPDVRWVGNEAGKTRDNEWSVLPLPQSAPGPIATDRQSWRALWALREQNQVADLGSRDAIAKAKALCWWPAETDVSIRPGWFWHAAEDHQVKSLATLLDCWFAAVGGNAVLLLNVPPNTRGLLAAPDQAVLHDLGRYLAATFAHDLAQTDGATQKHYAKVGEVYFQQPTTVDVFELREDLAALGQRVERFRIEVLQNGGWRECASGTTIGFRRLVRSEPITGDGFRYWIERSRGKAQIATFALYRRPTLIAAPQIARDAAGSVRLSADGLPVRYTIDGSPVGDDSPLFVVPFALPNGGVVRARTFAPADSPALLLSTAGETSATFGLAPGAFTVLACSSEQGGGEAASKAIDGDANTHWHSRYSPDTKRPPHSLTIDLGAQHNLTGFVYQPRAEGNNGTVLEYALAVSADGRDWQEVAHGTFANITNNPVSQVVRFERAAAGVRQVRFTALREVHDRAWASCGELSVLVK